MSTQNVLERFHAHLETIKAEVAAYPDYFPEGVFHWDQHWAKLAESLIAHYSEPHRHYHNLEHVVDGLDLMVEHEVASVLTKIAYVYHDVIYVPGASNGMNERASAFYANQQLEGVLPEAARQYIVDCILITIDHVAPIEFDELDRDVKLLIDIDLAGLGAPYEQFRKRTEDIYAEFMWGITTKEFVAGSKAFAEKMLKQQTLDGIFQTKEFAHLEKQARKNLTALTKGV